MTPKAIENFEKERLSADESSSVFFDHPIDRLKYFITRCSGKILKSEFSVDGLASVQWEEDGKRYHAWSTWPDRDYKIDWKPMA